ncbi:MAG: phosphonate C-P lyase system protein PhnG [Oceanospirillales bacterium]|uniref:Methylphosphonate degradation complex subunit PhnG n=1 Tax=Marinobacterium halophilum TaxID=267374 RepID=A0A2P8F3B8_9GAMM|nr:phosphonate C-P lyase system protein PhnG [Marinobacterium halophilum]MBR9827531.1 phosphonate C-P lyase system protein PhnG [Oceanospirillales bacterium]PSL16224.1 methylphosphonate degradation complex subunit PhnG [Marinobacterium halophilum]
MSVEQQQENPETRARQHWMGVLAKSAGSTLQQHWQALSLEPEYQFIRQPETGLTMLRGRVGGSGQPFNMGEMTLTRCAVRLASGTLGVSYVAGRSPQHAITAALADALLQEDDTQALLQHELIEPLQAHLHAEHQQRAAQANSTRVDFFTLVRGED